MPNCNAGATPALSTLGQSHLWDAPAGLGVIAVTGAWATGGKTPSSRGWNALGRGMSWRPLRRPVCSLLPPPLHAGSLVPPWPVGTHAPTGGRWLVRIEDVDTPRCQPGAESTSWHTWPRAVLVLTRRQSASTRGHHTCSTGAGPPGTNEPPCACSRKGHRKLHCWPLDTSASGTRACPLPRHLPPGSARGRSPRAWRLPPRIPYKMASSAR